ncbi:MAG: hypothetical protein AAFX92_15840 [Pseudomonadota bacterium]
MGYARIGAIFFGLWGLLHVVGAGAILVALAADTVGGFAFYQNAEGPFPAVAGAVLGYNSFAILWTGLLVIVIALFLNWRNDRLGLQANIALAGLSDLGLVIFLLIPGFVSLEGAALGLVLFVLASLFAILGYRSAKPPSERS